jgi:hypothetical protein
MHAFSSEAFVIGCRFAMSELGESVSLKVDFSKMSGHLRS